MSNKRVKKIINLRKEAKPMMSDRDKIIAYNLLGRKKTPIDVQLSWEEYICKVEFTFTPIGVGKHIRRTRHFIVTGHTELDLDAYIDSEAGIVIEEFSSVVKGYNVDYDIMYVKKLKIKE